MSNQDFFAASVNAHRASLQREARSERVARQALRAGRRSARAARVVGGRKASAAARERAITDRAITDLGRQPARAANASAVCGS
jgi:hypothetical protein